MDEMKGKTLVKPVKQTAEPKAPKAPSGIQLDNDEYKALRRLVANVMFGGDESKVPLHKAALRFALNFAADKTPPPAKPA